MTEQITKQKHEALQALLNDEYALIHLDPSYEGVVIPPNLMSSPTLTLKLSRWFRGVMAVEEDKICAELRFGRDYFVCTVPFAAIWGISNTKGEMTVWQETLPKSVSLSNLSQELKDCKERIPKPTLVQNKKTKNQKPSHLKRVK